VTQQCAARSHTHTHARIHRKQEIKAKWDTYSAICHGINNSEFYFTVAWVDPLPLSRSLVLSLAGCSFWPREIEIILTAARLLPNGQEKKVRFNQRASAVQLTEISIVITSRPMRRFH